MFTKTDKYFVVSPKQCFSALDFTLLSPLLRSFVPYVLVYLLKARADLAFFLPFVLNLSVFIYVVLILAPK